VPHHETGAGLALVRVRWPQPTRADLPCEGRPSTEDAHGLANLRRLHESLTSASFSSATTFLSAA
jgi:hypothetical protein